MKIENHGLEGKKEDKNVWKLPQHKVGDNGIHLESVTPHPLRAGNLCRILRNTNILKQALIMVMSV